ncbi:hypothetical protein [Leptolyngbya sp. O-77]|uniref:hypothetical protein n=1 Tax=Leptolyngbya sp. O-77 TaxID=1080068 RepID=UPI0012E3B983|nr:hypothetical protein [Leptolyngbya sp. O-77]
MPQLRPWNYGRGCFIRQPGHQTIVLLRTVNRGMGVFNSVRDEFLLIFGQGAIARQSLEYPGKSRALF